MRIINIVLRILFLLIISFVFTGWLFNFIQQITKYAEASKGGVAFRSQTISFNDVQGIIEFPFPLASFDVYARNDMTDTFDNSATSTKLDIDFLGNFQTILTGEEKIMYKNYYIYPLGLHFERSINAPSNNPKNLEGEFTIFLRPTNQTFIYTWIFLVIPIVYAFIVMFSACLKFVLIGSPIKEVLTEFKKIK